MPQNNRRAVGTRYEELAAAYLVQHGAVVIAKNFRARRGEIDLVARDGEYLVFAEVKYRSGTDKGSGADAVNRRKQYTICRISDFYRTRFGCRDSTPVRYDVLECTRAENGETGITWYKNAFPYLPARVKH